MADYDWDNHNRRVVLESRQILERSGASLARSNQVAIESENIGNEESYKQKFNSFKEFVVSKLIIDGLMIPGPLRSSGTKGSIASNPGPTEQRRRWNYQIKCSSQIDVQADPAQQTYFNTNNRDGNHNSRRNGIPKVHQEIRE
jgi:hypothetical protein